MDVRVLSFLSFLPCTVLLPCIVRGKKKHDSGSVHGFDRTCSRNMGSVCSMLGPRDMGFGLLLVHYASSID